MTALTVRAPGAGLTRIIWIADRHVTAVMESGTGAQVFTSDGEAHSVNESAEYIFSILTRGERGG